MSFRYLKGMTVQFAENYQDVFEFAFRNPGKARMKTVVIGGHASKTERPLSLRPDTSFSDRA